jgi:hypothetical protein
VADGEHLENHRLAKSGHLVLGVLEEPIDADGVRVVSPAQVPEGVDDSVVLGCVRVSDRPVEARHHSGAAVATGVPDLAELGDVGQCDPIRCEHLGEPLPVGALFLIGSVSAIVA